MKIAMQVVLLVTLISAGAPIAMAQQQAESQAVETLTYDVSALVRPRRNYPLPDVAQPQVVGRGSVQRAPQTMPSGESPVTLDRVVELLQDLVDRDSWRDNGGNTGSIRIFGTVLVIAQTHANHQAIGKLLASLSNNQAVGAMLNVRVLWVDMDLRSTAAANRPPGEDKWSELIEVPDGLLDNNHVIWSGQTTCFNGQTVHVASGRETNYVSDVTPIVGTQAAALDPTMAQARNGVQLQVTPQLVPSGDSAVLDLHSIVTQSSTPAAIPVPTTNRSLALAQDIPSIERVVTSAQELHTTVRLPLHKKLLIGGMTMSSLDAGGQNRPIYLVVEVNAVR
ncbi:MAG TPA: hypothetical protein VHD56_00420 [Tepidisphaeraceae bacterium]|nr:hypothetical protein [Tepidisphaeraceae bacterium]